uniref:Uncharacterized protein n=1 Tax=Anopheles atroparvus TaxID=41427 RepID=A0AAG5D0R2_ANOAO
VGVSVITRSFRNRRHAETHIVARVQPRASKGITDLLSLSLILLNTNCPAKQLSQVCLRTQGRNVRSHSLSLRTRGHSGQRSKRNRLTGILVSMSESRSLSE